MRRWLLAGAALAVGVVVIRQVLALPAVHDVLVTTAADLRGMIAEVKDGMAQRESELRSALGIDAGVDAEVSRHEDRSVLDDPTGPRAR